MMTRMRGKIAPELFPRAIGLWQKERNNKPAALCEFSEMGEVAIIYHILAPIGYLLLLLLVNRTARGKKKKKTVAKKPATPK